MAHLKKYTRAATGHLFAHYERKMDEKGEYIKFGNQDINTEKTHLNYNLAPEQNQTDHLQKRLSEVHCMKRADVNVMCSWVITAPKDLPENMMKPFFESTYRFLVKQYGEENVLSSYVHMDETTPHMHFSFIPVTYDQKKERYKVSAKDVISKNHLKGFHKALEHHLSNELGFDVQILNEATKEGNKTINELKRETALQELEELTAKIEKAREIGFNIKHIDEIPVKVKGLKEKTVTMSMDDYEDLCKTYKTNMVNFLEHQTLIEQRDYYQDEAERLKNQLKDVHNRWFDGKSKNRDLERENAKMSAYIKSTNQEASYENFNNRILQQQQKRGR